MNGLDRRLADSRGFSSIDLVALITVVGLIALCSVPAAGSNLRTSQALLCLANKNQLARAFSLYAADNNDVFAENYHGGGAIGGSDGLDPRKSPWATGWIDWTLRPDNTNVAFIRDVRYARLAPFIQIDRNVHRCPADTLLGEQQKAAGWSARIRSISMDATIGNGNQFTGPWPPEFFRMRSFREVGQKNPPSALMTFVDEAAMSIGDAVIFGPRTNLWVDMPAANHQGSGAFAFVDGHAELHKWKGSVLRQRFSEEVLPGDPYVAWYRDHIGRRP